MKTGWGHRCWCIPDMYLPHPCGREVDSHETICLMNTGDDRARITMTALFEDDAPPVVISGIEVEPMKSRHIRMDRLSAWQSEIPPGVPYSLLIESSRNVVAEYSRLNWIDGQATTFGVMGHFEP